MGWGGGWGGEGNDVHVATIPMSIINMQAIIINRASTHKALVRTVHNHHHHHHHHHNHIFSFMFCLNTPKQLSTDHSRLADTKNKKTFAKKKAVGCTIRRGQCFCASTHSTLVKTVLQKASKTNLFVSKVHTTPRLPRMLQILRTPGPWVIKVRFTLFYLCFLFCVRTRAFGLGVETAPFGFSRVSTV